MCCHQGDAFLEVGHVIGALVLSIPLDNAILVDSVIATRLPSVSALGRPVPYTLLFAQLVQIAQSGWGQHMVEA